MIFKYETYVCENCETVAVPERINRGSLGMEIILWCFFLFPGIIYSLWRQKSLHYACPECGSEKIFLADSPRGKRMIANLLKK